MEDDWLPEPTEHEIIVALRAELHQYKVALEFYADPQAYGLHGGNVNRILGDGGFKAREALSWSLPFEKYREGKQ
jgi:hypothetical protein